MGINVAVLLLHSCVSPPEFSGDFLQGEEHTGTNPPLLEFGLVLLRDICRNATSKLQREKKSKLLVPVSVCSGETWFDVQEGWVAGAGGLLAPAAAGHALCLHVDASVQDAVVV